MYVTIDMVKYVTSVHLKYTVRPILAGTFVYD